MGELEARISGSLSDPDLFSTLDKLLHFSLSKTKGLDNMIFKISSSLNLSMIGFQRTLLNEIKSKLLSFKYIYIMQSLLQRCKILTTR